MWKVLIIRFFVLVVIAFIIYSSPHLVHILNLIGIHDIGWQYLIGIFAFLWFILDTAVICHLLGEPILPTLKKLTIWISKFALKIGFKIDLSPSAKFVTLRRSLTKYDNKCVKKIREDIKREAIDYLLPILPSCEQWGMLFSSWNNRVGSGVDYPGIRWVLLSDYYLFQEHRDLLNGNFATDLDLYARTILLNSYLSLDPNKRLIRFGGNNLRPTIWIFTKMLPTDWPLCAGTCAKTSDPCFSKNQSNERKFLTDYMMYLKKCANLFHNTDFCRYIIVTDQLGQGFKTEQQLGTSLISHKQEYFTMIHRNSLGDSFGKSFKMKIDSGIAKVWPPILNDAVFYGTTGAGGPQWHWAICTTYLSGHPVILLKVFNIANPQERKDLGKELTGLAEELTNMPISSGDPLDIFTNWALEKRNGNEIK